MINYTNTRTFASGQKSFDQGLKSYMLKIYNYMTMALVMTGVAAYATLNFEPISRLMFQVGPNGQFIGATGLSTIISIAPIGIALYFFMGFGKMSLQTTKTLFWVYSILTGMSLSYLGLIYTGESIARTFFITASAFGGMSIYGYTTEKDLTSIGSFLMMGLMGIIIASLANMFFHSAAISFATSLVGVAVFIGLIAWDTQKLKAMYYSSGGGELGQKLSIMGAFTLYLDFINLFLYALRFLGNRRD
ncbi:MAG: Bax inhibitor-1/YccA family protein [Rickettsiaceae bacterium]|nr:MAG: Bax inhibitor-1/YccA family protein [Rickettsiaceae bacterium]